MNKECMLREVRLLIDPEFVYRNEGEVRVVVKLYEVFVEFLANVLAINDPYGKGADRIDMFYVRRMRLYVHDDSSIQQPRLLWCG